MFDQKSVPLSGISKVHAVLDTAKTVVIPKGRLHKYAVPYTKQLLSEPLLLRAAAIPLFIEDAPHVAGITAAHQLIESGFQEQDWLHNLPLLTLSTSRFAIVTRYNNVSSLQRKIANGVAITLCTEYPLTSRQIVRQAGIKAVIKSVDLGSSEARAQYVMAYDGALVITETGKTLFENNLAIAVDRLRDIELRLIWTD